MVCQARLLARVVASWLGNGSKMFMVFVEKVVVFTCKIADCGRGTRQLRMLCAIMRLRIFMLKNKLKTVAKKILGRPEPGWYRVRTWRDNGVHSEV